MSCGSRMCPPTSRASPSGGCSSCRWSFPLLLGGSRQPSTERKEVGQDRPHRLAALVRWSLHDTRGGAELISVRFGRAAALLASAAVVVGACGGGATPSP